ncbi:MAG TPA: 23S rRNA (pseudouridine(1915)-N(3))-methyltransferase RlmH [Gemmatimonadaceae bacterium]|nr:23S rRNA (pseudouridine(1915)-N(3))-methyltransferase RlmH [Gemmatimonadaceae bacterium]
MQIDVAVVGRTRDPLAGAVAEYEGRAARYWSLNVHEVREESARASTADVVRRREGERLLERVPASAQLVVCDERGVALSSRQFADWLGERRDRAQDVAFAIGGAYGLDAPLRSRASLVLALAHWTMPHELARLVLVEQLYRAGTLLRGEPYHK